VEPRKNTQSKVRTSKLLCLKGSKNGAVVGGKHLTTLPSLLPPKLHQLTKIFTKKPNNYTKIFTQKPNNYIMRPSVLLDML